jgi:hypothetical protein
MKACFKKLMHGEPIGSFLFKQTTGVLLGAFLATAWGSGTKFYNSLTHQPICKISFKEKNSIGYFYNWSVQIKDKNKGGFLLYPKDDALIKLSSIKRPLRVTEAHKLGEYQNGEFSRGIKFIYTEGTESLQLEFETYSDKLLNIVNTKDAACEDLLSNL